MGGGGSGVKFTCEEGPVMLSRSLTSCLIKPLANDFVSVINSICSLKRSVHTQRSQGLSPRMIIEVYGMFYRVHVDICGLQGNG